MFRASFLNVVLVYERNGEIIHRCSRLPDGYHVGYVFVAKDIVPINPVGVSGGSDSFVRGWSN